MVTLPLATRLDDADYKASTEEARVCRTHRLQGQLSWWLQGRVGVAVAEALPAEVATLVSRTLST